MRGSVVELYDTEEVGYMCVVLGDAVERMEFDLPACLILSSEHPFIGVLMSPSCHFNSIPHQKNTAFH